MRFILASGSPRRRELLKQVGIEFEVIVSDVSEVITESIPKLAVCELARQKAMAVFENTDGEVTVIGADTVVAADGLILGKPKSEEEAFHMLRRLAGREHSVYTGVSICVRRNGETEVINFAEETKVYVYDMTDEQIEAYIKTGEPMDKAGAYGIQGRFAAYVKGICGDYNNVVGLPVGKLCSILREKNIEYTM